MSKQLSKSTIQKLRRWSTPTVYNGWEAITKHDRRGGNFNLEETTDFMTEAPPMVGYAVTMVTEPSNPSHQEHAEAWGEYLRYVARIEGPKIAVIQDLDKPNIVGSIVGEVISSMHRSLGCVGLIVDGAIRDIDEIRSVGLKALAKRLCVGHCYAHPVRWNCDVNVFGCNVSPGTLIHADSHGFLVIPPEDGENLLEASARLDGSECDTIIRTARYPDSTDSDRIISDFEDAQNRHGKTIEETRKQFGP
jgi:regulator of RNase E activity RraA